ncbi:MAG TPA: regulator [Gammaproteobacteria bacterium]|nr:regulator [Gammaproteobacteria bacterium]
MCVSVVACSENTPSSVDNDKVSQGSRSYVGLYGVSDSFNVGKNVFVRALAVDDIKQGLWIGTSVGVLDVDLRTKAVRQTFTRENGLANEYVFAAFQAANGAVWFGTNGGGSSRYKAGKWKTYFPMHGLADYWVYAFAEQKNKALWVGTWAGLSKLDYGTGKFTTYIKELVNEWVYGLAVDSQDRVWIGTEGGVNMYDGENWHTWTHKQGLGSANRRHLEFSANTGLGTRSRHDLSVLVAGGETYNPNYVFCIKVAPDDSVWAGTWGGGVSHYNGQKWQNLTSDDGLAGDIVYSIAIGKNGNYWFGTNKGLSVYDGSKWQTLTQAHGLLDTQVYALAIDSNGRVWAGTKNGVAVIERM